MKYPGTAILFAAALASCSPIQYGRQAPTYVNPVLGTEFPDPAVLRSADGWFYAYATQGTPADTTLNIQTARSVDLVYWELVGDALPEKPRWARSKQKFWAPHVLHDPEQRKYFMYFSAEPDDASGKCLAVAVSAVPAGPFADSGAPLLCGDGIEHIDPMAFDDPQSGKRLLYWGSGRTPIRVQELAGDRMRFAPGSRPQEILFPDARKEFSALVEGAWVIFRGGYYYLFYSGDLCCGPNARYAVMAARSHSAFGPFEHFQNPARSGSSVILAGNASWRAPGHNSIALDDAGDDWILYHAMDGKQPTDLPAATARLLLLDRIVYVDGWPRIKGDEPSSLPQAVPVIR